MTVFPEEVTATAVEIVGDLGSLPESVKTFAVTVVARGIMVERRRCIAIAEGVPTGKLKAQRIAHQVGLSIATAIRGQAGR